MSIVDGVPGDDGAGDLGDRQEAEAHEAKKRAALIYGSPIVPDHVRQAIQALDAADAEQARVQAQAVQAMDERKKAVDGVANAFLDLYNALPTDARNKVRHAINTTAKT